MQFDLEKLLEAKPRYRFFCLNCNYSWLSKKKAMPKRLRCRRCWSSDVINLSWAIQGSRVLKAALALKEGRLPIPGPLDILGLPFNLALLPADLASFDMTLKAGGVNKKARLRAWTLMALLAGASDDTIEEFLNQHKDGVLVDPHSFIEETRLSLSEAERQTLALKSGDNCEDA